jgi:hypothetical protein
MLTGTLIAESLRVGTTLSDLRLAVSEIRRLAPGDTSPDQPAEWTLLEFTAPDTDASALADAFAGALLAEGGWYADFRTSAETYVIFADRVFRYPRGDQAAREEAKSYGRTVSVPEPQLDWTV